MRGGIAIVQGDEASSLFLARCLLQAIAPLFRGLVRFPKEAEAQQDGLSQLVEPIASVWRRQLASLTSYLR